MILQNGLNYHPKISKLFTSTIVISLFDNALSRLLFSTVLVIEFSEFSELSVFIIRLTFVSVLLWKFFCFLTLFSSFSIFSPSLFVTSLLIFVSPITLSQICLK